MYVHMRVHWVFHKKKTDSPPPSLAAMYNTVLNEAKKRKGACYKVDRIRETAFCTFDPCPASRRKNPMSHAPKSSMFFFPSYTTR